MTQPTDPTRREELADELDDKRTEVAEPDRGDGDEETAATPGATDAADDGDDAADDGELVEGDGELVEGDDEPESDEATDPPE